jgi:hypothetical protein
LCISCLVGALQNMYLDFEIPNIQPNYVFHYASVLGAWNLRYMGSFTLFSLLVISLKIDVTKTSIQQSNIRILEKYNAYYSLFIHFNNCCEIFFNILIHLKCNYFPFCFWRIQKKCKWCQNQGGNYSRSKESKIKENKAMWLNTKLHNVNIIYSKGQSTFRVCILSKSFAKSVA